MRRLAFKKIDAFATAASAGNPAGAVYLQPGEEISAEEMQQMARELKGFVTEVGFVRPLDAATFDLKYYSSEREVEFCGHATIAILYDLFKNDEALRKKPAVDIVTRKGRLRVENRLEREDAVFISAPRPRFSPTVVDRTRLAEALRTDAGCLAGALPLKTVNAGLETLLVPVRTLPAILALAPHLAELRRFCESNALDIVTVFTDEVANPANAYRTRVFAPTFGYLEDPATGSGNAALGYYLLAQQAWDGGTLSLEQNGDLARPNSVKLLARQDERQEWQVLFGGGAITKIDGTYLLGTKASGCF